MKNNDLCNVKKCSSNYWEFLEKVVSVGEFNNRVICR